MDQFFCHYEKWEDFQNGMYRTESEKDFIHKSIEVLSDPDLCFMAMFRVVTEWEVSTKVNLSNTAVNRRAWLGQAACCIVFNVPESHTKTAWGLMTDEQRNEANKIAEEIILNWELNYKRECQKNTLVATY